MAEFRFRPYCETTDFDIIYQAACDYGKDVTQYEVSCGYYPEKESYRQALKNRFDRHLFPIMVVDDNDHAIGMTFPYDRYRLGRCWKLQIHLWERKELTKEVLRGSLQQLFEDGYTDMVIIQLPGNEEELLAACRCVGMKEVSRIPNRRSYKGKLVTEYGFALSYEKWKELIELIS